MKISQRVSELLSGHLIVIDRQTDRWMDSRTDKVIGIRPPLTSSGGALINDTEKILYNIITYLHNCGHTKGLIALSVV